MQEKARNSRSHREQRVGASLRELQTPAPSVEPDAIAMQSGQVEEEAAAQTHHISTKTAADFTRRDTLYGETATSTKGRKATGIALAILAFQTLGVVYGDIGTSPLYVLSGIFTESPSEQDVIGAISTIIWTITVVALIKYVGIILWAGDDNGEGGLFVLFMVIARYTGLSIRGPHDEGDFALTNYHTSDFRNRTQGSGIGRTLSLSLMRRTTKGKKPANDFVTPSKENNTSELTTGRAGSIDSRAAVKILNDDTASGQPRQRRASAQVEVKAIPRETSDLEFAEISGSEQDNFLTLLFLRHPWTSWILICWTLFGASLIISDGLLTPAVSVLSAVQGITIPAPDAQNAVVPVACVILALLFLSQRFGTRVMAMMFSPIVFLWSLSLLVNGIYNVTYYPGIFRAWNPAEMVNWFVRTQDFRYLSGVILCITGVEALFADLGHFSRPAIQISFVSLIYPSLILAYLGQGARLIDNPDLVIQNPFYQSIPGPQGGAWYWIVFILALLATIIASQAMITATFSLVHQAIAMNCFPPLHVVHTDSRRYGQIFIPMINYILMVTVILVTIGFGLTSTTAINNAYGFAVSAVLFITTTLLVLTMRIVWQFWIIVCLAFFVVFAFVDGLFFAATLTKIPTGAWFPLAISVLLAIFMTFWKWCTTRKVDFELDHRYQLSSLFTHHDNSTEVAERQPYQQDVLEDDKKVLDTGLGDYHLPEVSKQGGSLADDTQAAGAETGAIDALTLSEEPEALLRRRKVNVIEKSHTLDDRQVLYLKANHLAITRLPGLALFYNTSGGRGVPHTFAQFLKLFPAVADTIIFIHIRYVMLPRVLADERIAAEKIRQYPGFYTVQIRFGYMEPVKLEQGFVKDILSSILAIERDTRARNLLEQAERDSLATHIIQAVDVRAVPGSNIVKRFVLSLYRFIEGPLREENSWLLPPDQLLQVGIRAEI